MDKPEIKVLIRRRCTCCHGEGIVKSPYGLLFPSEPGGSQHETICPVCKGDRLVDEWIELYRLELYFRRRRRGRRNVSL